MQMPSRVTRFFKSRYSLMLAFLVMEVLGGMAIAHSVAWPFIFLVMIPMCTVVYQQGVSSRWRTFLFSWILGLSFMGTVIYWVFNGYPLDWAGIADPVRGFIITTAIWFVISATLSFFIALWAVAARFLIRRNAFDLIIIPISWVIFEWLRMWGFTLVTWGSGSVFIPYFSFGMIGFPLGNSTALLQVARFGGAYVLSAVVAFVSMIIWVAIINKTEILPRRRAIALAGACLIIYIIFVFIPYVPPHPSLRIATIETDFPSTLTVSDAKANTEADIIKMKLAAIAESGVFQFAAYIPLFN